MYNLIVSGQPDAWDGEPFDLGRTRVAREYTDEALRLKFDQLDDTDIAELLSVPTLFAYESGVGQSARLGRLTRVRNRQGVVRFDYVLDDSFAPIPPDVLASLSWELDIGKYELNRTHWAVKAIDLSEALLEARLITPEQAAGITPRPPMPLALLRSPELLIRPTAFQVPQLEMEADLVSVMMPFDAGFANTWSSIQRACTAAGLRCLRADSIWQESVLVQDVFDLIWRSSMVVVDFTGKNPNVMYETGIAHTLGRPVVPIAQAIDDVPFDLRHHRFLRYLPNSEGLTDMEVSLSGRLRTLATRSVG